MKTKTNFMFLIGLFGNFCFAQTQPNVTIATPELLVGTGQIGTTVEISINNDNVSELHLKVDDQGNFLHTFNPALTVGNNIIIWTLNSSNEISPRIAIPIENPTNALYSIVSNPLNSKTFTNASVSGRTVDYKATIWNTNFSIPLARFNFTKNDDTKLGDLLLFNSIGAGFGMSWGELSETRNEQGTLINQEFVNTFGLHLGFLFSAGTGEDIKNVFAPTFNVSILDFQLGLGYELGTISQNQNRTFLTLSYAIPLYKLRKGGFWIWKASEPITSPLQSRLGK